MAQKIVIASGKGGVGKTSLCVGIGKALSTLGKRVLLIDCDCLRSLDLLTGVTEQMVYNFGDVIFGRCSSEEALYENEGLSVITCPESYDNISDYSMKWLVGKYEKDDIRKMAEEAGIPVASKPDSQEICFIPDNDYARFIKEYGSGRHCYFKGWSCSYLWS